MTISFNVQGTPRGKARPRFANGHAFTPQSTRDYEAAIGWEAKAAGARPLDLPCSVRMVATFPVPASWPKKRKEAALRGKFRHVTKPDADNIIKNLDSLNGICWIDDSQVFEVSLEKCYGTEPSLFIEIQYVPLP